VAGSSVQEIDRLIAELQTLRRLLQTEGARVRGKSLSTLQTTDLITGNIAKLKSDADATTLGRYDELQRRERCRATTGLRPSAVLLVQKDDGQHAPTGAPARSL
jgi:hypothetical protein